VSAEPKRSSAPAQPRRSVASAVPRRSSAAAKPPAEAPGRRLPTDWNTFTDIFRAYAEYIFDYCIGVLGDQTEAAGATTVTFIQAHSLLGRLPDPDRLEAWLYALARRECTSKHPARAETPAGAPQHAADGAQADEAGSSFALAQAAGSGAALADEATGSADAGDAPNGGRPRRNLADDDTDEFSAISPADERRQAARQVLNAFSALPADDRELLTAFSALPPRDREVLDLVYWHGLRPAELAAILGVSAQRAHTVLNAAVRRFRAAAERIQDTAAAAGEEPTRSEDKLLAAMPVARMPGTVWKRTARAVTDPGLRSYRDAVVAHAGRLGLNGFPSQPAVPGSRARTLQMAAAVALPLAGGAALLMILHGSSPGTSPPASLAATANAPGTSAGSSQTHTADAKASRKAPLPIGALFPTHSAQGSPPVVTTVPAGGTHPSPSPSSVRAPSPAPSRISHPPSPKPSPSHSSGSPTPTPTTPSPTPDSPTPTGSPSS
jgi:RNA polymerase sigma factor (sigma-70 family)